MDNSSNTNTVRERSQATAMMSTRRIHAVEPTAEVARVTSSTHQEDYETAKREGGVQAVREAVKNTRLSLAVPATPSGSLVESEPSISRLVVGPHYEPPHHRASTGARSSTSHNPRMRNSIAFDPRERTTMEPNTSTSTTATIRRASTASSSASQGSKNAHVKRHSHSPTRSPSGDSQGYVPPKRYSPEPPSMVVGLQGEDVSGFFTDASGELLEAEYARTGMDSSAMRARQARRQAKDLPTNPDHQIKAGLRNPTSATTPGVVAVRKSHDSHHTTSGHSTPPKLTQVEADARVKAGLRHSRISSADEKSPPRGQIEADARIKAGLRGSHSRASTTTAGSIACPDAATSQVEADARLKAGLRNSRNSSVVGATNNTLIPPANLQLAVSSGAGSVASTEPTNSSSSTTHHHHHHQDPDTRLKAGLRNSRVGASSLVGAVSVQSNTHTGVPAAASQAEGDALAKAGLRNNRRRSSRAGATSTTGLPFTQAEMDKFDRHYESGMSSAEDEQPISDDDDVNQQQQQQQQPPPPQHRHSRGLRNSRTHPDPAMAKFGMIRNSRQSGSSPPPHLPQLQQQQQQQQQFEEDPEIQLPRQQEPDVEITVPRGAAPIRPVSHQPHAAAVVAGTIPPPPPNNAHTDLAHVQQQAQQSEAYRQSMTERDQFKEEETKCSKTLVYGIIGLLVVAIVAIVVGVVVGTGGSDSGSDNDAKQGTPAPESSGGPKGMVPIAQVFPTISLPAGTVEAIEGQAGRDPQVKAYNWLVEDPHGTNYTEAQRLQRFALATFYFNTNGDRWLDDPSQNNWLNYDTHECEWLSYAYQQSRHVCNGYVAGSATLFDHYDYSALVLSGDPKANPSFHERVRGNLVPELALLTNLQTLDCGFQILKGNIPSELGLLSDSLSRLVLYENSLTGTVPTSIFSNVDVLWLSKNQFDGATIPSEIGLNRGLHSLLLIDAGFGGTLPKELFQTGSHFVDLKMEKNDIEGPIPTEIGLARHLTNIQLSKSRYSGDIPSQLGLLNKVVFLDIADNALEGSLPTQLGNLEGLTSLDVVGNELRGALPSELGRLRQLRDLKISYAEPGFGMRDLTGHIPMELFTTAPTRSSRLLQVPNQDDDTILLGGGASNATDLLTSNTTTNALMEDSAIQEETLSIPARPTPAFPHLVHLWIEDTNLKGTVPTEIAWMTNLQTLRLGWNRQSSPGTLPSELGRLGNRLKELTLAAMNLQSTIPTELGLLRVLERFDVSNNDLTGVLPGELAAWRVPPLEWFTIGGNDGLEGTIPNHFCSIQATEFGCSAGGNSLCGCNCGACS